MDLPDLAIYGLWSTPTQNRVDGSINSPVPHITGHTGP
jgi:hypothetical protein